MRWLDRIFKSRDHASEQAVVTQEYRAMTEAVSRETPEQTARFYLEVAAQLGNKSAAARLATMGSDLARAKPN